MAAGLFEGKRILIMGGTGSLGSALLRRLREGRNGGAVTHSTSRDCAAPGSSTSRRR